MALSHPNFVDGLLRSPLSGEHWHTQFVAYKHLRNDKHHLGLAADFAQAASFAPVFFSRGRGKCLYQYNRRMTLVEMLGAHAQAWSE
jgi:hypothetical protein